MPNWSVCVAFLKTLLPRESSRSKVSLRAAAACVVGAIERQCAYVDGLAGLVDGLLRGQQDGNSIVEPHLLGELGFSDGRIGHVMQSATARQSGGKPELRLGGSARVEAAGEEHARLAALRRHLDPYGTRARDRIVRGIGDDHAHGRLAPAQIGLLSQNVDHRHAQDLGDGFRAFDRRHAFWRIVGKPVTQTLPRQFVDADGVIEFEIDMPGAFSGFRCDAPLHAAEHVVFRIEDFYGSVVRGPVSGPDKEWRRAPRRAYRSGRAIRQGQEPRRAPERTPTGSGRRCRGGRPGAGSTFSSMVLRDLKSASPRGAAAVEAVTG